MYTLITFIEKIINKIRIKIKISYWKLKFGKRIKIGKKLAFRKRVKILIEKDGYLEIGDNNFLNNDCSINCQNRIVIGNNNLFGENVKIYDHNHVFNKSDEDLMNTFNTGNINIGNNNWFGTNVVILKNAALENRNVIAASVILNQKIDSYKIVRSKNELGIDEILVK